MHILTSAPIFGAIDGKLTILPMKILDAYKYLFYRIYIYYMRLFGDSWGPHESAYLNSGVLVYVNLVSLVFIIDGFLGLDFISYMANIKLLIAVLNLIVIEIVSYFIFIKGGKYLEIKKRFDRESNEERKRKTKWVLLYILGTAGLFILSVVFA